jgi:hypothetical protein
MFEEDCFDFKDLMENLPLPALLAKVVYNKDGKAIDIVRKWFNEKYLDISPFSREDDIKTINNLASEVVSEFFKNNPDWLDIVSDVALNGTKKEFIRYFSEYKLWLKFRFFSPKKEYFFWIGNDVTKQMIAQQESTKTELFLPICSYCKKIRDSNGVFKNIENYFVENLKIKLTHGLCMECVEKYYPELNC